jgi:hypothetical protein
VTLLPERGVGFALLNNLHETKLNLALGNALIDHLLGLPAKDWTAHYQKAEADERAAKATARKKRDAGRQADVPPTHPPQRYVGGYEQPAYGGCTVAVASGKLEWRYSTFVAPLEHWQGDTFRVTDGQFEDELIEFITSKEGVTAVRFRGLEFRRK